MLGEINVPHVRVYKEQQTMLTMSASPPLVEKLIQRKPEKNLKYMDSRGLTLK